jgi:hypothetical protein
MQTETLSGVVRAALKLADDAQARGDVLADIHHRSVVPLHDLARQIRNAHAALSPAARDAIEAR